MQTFKDLLRAKGMTQAELAKKIGVSERAIEHWSCGTRVPNLRCAYYAACALGVSLEELAIIFLYPENGGKGIKAKAIDIDENGGLVVEYLEGPMINRIESITSGEVTIRPEYI